MLIGTRNILEAGEKYYKDSNDDNLFALEMIKHGYDELIESLDSHKSPQIHELAEQLLTFFIDVGTMRDDNDGDPTAGRNSGQFIV